MQNKTIIAMFAIIVALSYGLTNRALSLADRYITLSEQQQVWNEKVYCHYAIQSAIHEKSENVDFINNNCQ